MTLNKAVMVFSAVVITVSLAGTVAIIWFSVNVEDRCLAAGGKMVMVKRGVSKCVLPR